MGSGGETLNGEILELVDRTEYVLASGARPPRDWQLLNATAHAAVVGLLAGRTVREVALDLATEASVEPEQVERDLGGVLDQLRGAGWLREGNADPVPDVELGEALGVGIAHDLVGDDVGQGLLAEAHRGAVVPATLYRSGSRTQEVGEDRRRTKKVELDDAFRDALAMLVFERTTAFHTPDTTWAERPQLLRYDVGDYFRLHRDRRPGGDVPVLDARRTAVVIGLGDPHGYEGGELVLRAELPDMPALDWPVRLGNGTAVLFDAEMQHQVRPVTAGTRVSVVTWLCAPLPDASDGSSER